MRDPREPAFGQKQWWIFGARQSERKALEKEREVVGGDNGRSVGDNLYPKGYETRERVR